MFDLITADNQSNGMGIGARAQALGTINYEVATSLSARLPRVYVDDFV